MSDILQIGAYQLKNLLAQRVSFFYFDLSAVSTKRDGLFESCRGVGALSGAELLSLLQAESAAKDSPIVLICENGAKSMVVARHLTDNSYINVFVIEGGVQAIEKH